MKVLHIGKYFSPFSGGLENYMRDAMVALARRGIATLALVHQHRLSLKTSNETFSANGIEFSVTRTGLWARLLFTPISPAFVWHLRRIIKSDKPDVLHLHLPNPSVFWSLILPTARKLPWVVHWHSDVITSEQGLVMRFFYQLYRPFEQAVLNRAKVIIATSPPYRDSSLPLRNWLGKTSVVPLGMDMDRFPDINSARDIAIDSSPPSPLDTADPDDPAPLQVLAIGRLTYYKGFNYLVEAIARTQGVRLNLVGGGDQATQLKKLAATLEVEERVTFLGHLSDTELARQMESCDCLCLPSIERTEAFGMVLLEAMYYGKATVIGNVEGSGMGWVVDDSRTGIKVEPADTEALARALAHLSENRDAVVRLGQAGRRKFDEHFDINQSVEKLLEIYQQVRPAAMSAGQGVG